MQAACHQTRQSRGATAGGGRFADPKLKGQNAGPQRAAAQQDWSLPWPKPPRGMWGISAMVFRTQCRCGCRLQLTPEHFGKQVRCPSCHAVAMVPLKPRPARVQAKNHAWQRHEPWPADSVSDSATYSSGGTCSMELVVLHRSCKRRRSSRYRPRLGKSASSWHLLAMALLGGLLGSYLARLAWG